MNAKSVNMKMIVWFGLLLAIVLSVTACSTDEDKEGLNCRRILLWIISSLRHKLRHKHRRRRNGNQWSWWPTIWRVTWITTDIWNCMGTTCRKNIHISPLNL